MAERREGADRRMHVMMTVNGEPRQADDVWPGENLLYVLRERLGLPGSKNACEQGECGSCTVYLDGVPVCACLVAAHDLLARNARPSDLEIREALAGNLCRCTGYGQILAAVRAAADRLAAGPAQPGEQAGGGLGDRPSEPEGEA